MTGRVVFHKTIFAILFLSKVVDTKAKKIYKNKSFVSSREIPFCKLHWRCFYDIADRACHDARKSFDTQ